MAEDSPLGLLSFLSFGFSIIAAVLAIDMYTLLRTGQFGNSWRVMIIASVIFALVQVLRLAEILHWESFQVYALSQIVELVFVIALAYAFFLQRKAFTLAERHHKATEEPEDYEDEADDTRATEWDDFSSRYNDEDDIASGTDVMNEQPSKSSAAPAKSRSSLTLPNPPN